MLNAHEPEPTEDDPEPTWHSDEYENAPLEPMPTSETTVHWRTISVPSVNWEYKVLHIDPLDINAAEKPNELGKQGWEMFGPYLGYTGKHVCWFKRPLEEGDGNGQEDSN